MAGFGLLRLLLFLKLLEILVELAFQRNRLRTELRTDHVTYPFVDQIYAIYFDKVCN